MKPFHALNYNGALCQPCASSPFEQQLNEDLCPLCRTIRGAVRCEAWFHEWIRRRREIL